RAEGVFRDEPSVWENHEVDIGGAGRLRRRGEHREDRWVGMIKQDRTDGGVLAEIVFVRRIVPVPGNDVEWGIFERSDPQIASPLHEQLAAAVLFLVSRNGRQKVALVGQSVGTDGSALRQREGACIVLTDVAAGKSIPELSADLDAARDDGDLAGLDVDDAELGPEPELSLLRYEEHLAVSVVEILVLHRARNEIEVRAHASLSAGVAGRGE